LIPDVRPILQNVIPLITTGADLEFVRETDALMNARQDERDQEVDAIQLELRCTFFTLPVRHRRVEAARAKHAWLSFRLAQLDTQKFSLGKTINERQSRAARTEKEIEMLREEVEELTREREDWDRGVLPSGSAGGDELDGEA
jgi:chromosome segregation ATPase